MFNFFSFFDAFSVRSLDRIMSFLLNKRSEEQKKLLKD